MNAKQAAKHLQEALFLVGRNLSNADMGIIASHFSDFAHEQLTSAELTGDGMKREHLIALIAAPIYAVTRLSGLDQLTLMENACWEANALLDVAEAKGFYPLPGPYAKNS